MAKRSEKVEDYSGRTTDRMNNQYRGAEIMIIWKSSASYPPSQSYEDRKRCIESSLWSCWGGQNFSDNKIVERTLKMLSIKVGIWD